MAYIIDDEPLGSNGYLSTSGFPEWGYDERDDSDDVYYDTWEELAEAVARQKAFWARERAKQVEEEVNA